MFGTGPAPGSGPSPQDTDARDAREAKSFQANGLRRRASLLKPNALAFLELRLRSR